MDKFIHRSFDPSQQGWGQMSLKNKLVTFLKWNDALTKIRNKLNMKYIGTKSIQLGDIMVYLDMLSTTIKNGQAIKWFADIAPNKIQKPKNRKKTALPSFSYYENISIS